MATKKADTMKKMNMETIMKRKKAQKVRFQNVSILELLKKKIIIIFSTL